MRLPDLGGAVNVRLATPPHVAETVERLTAMYPGARIETETRWFIRVYRSLGSNELCVDVRNLPHGDD